MVHPGQNSSLRANWFCSGLLTARNRPRRRRADRRIRQSEVRVVENIERLRSKLQMESVADRDALEQREVPLLEARAGENVTSRIAEGETGRRYKCRGVKPAAHGAIAIRDDAARDAVRPLRAAGIGHIDVERWRNSVPGLDRQDAVHLPAAQ